MKIIFGFSLESLELSVGLALAKLVLDLGNELVSLGVVFEIHVVISRQLAAAQLAAKGSKTSGAEGATTRLRTDAVAPAVGDREYNETTITTMAVLLTLVAALHEADLAPARVQKWAALEPAAAARHVAGTH